MSGFGAWLWRIQNSANPDAQQLSAIANGISPAWPLDSTNKPDYVSAIRTAVPAPQRDDALRYLDNLWQFYQQDLDNYRQNKIVSHLTSPQLMITLISLGLIIAAVVGINKDFLRLLAGPEFARGLITFLFAVATVGLAVMLVVNSFLSNAGGEQLAERFRQGKDILTVLIGVFGTIVGFYFGQAGPPGQSSTPVTQDQRQQSGQPGSQSNPSQSQQQSSPQPASTPNQPQPLQQTPAEVQQPPPTQDQPQPPQQTPAEVPPQPSSQPAPTQDQPQPLRPGPAEGQPQAPTPEGGG